MGKNLEDERSSEEELIRLKRECKAMVRYLEELEAEEHKAVIANTILAREALLNGYRIDTIDQLNTSKVGRGTVKRSASSGVKTTALADKK